MGWPQIITENGALAQSLLNRHQEDDNDEFDVIVVGSGMGGGVVASALADENKRVLVLEAGSMIFPTHVGNLPRRILIGEFQKHIWSVWEKWSVKNYNTVGKHEYKGAQAFNLGGRSMFWGASIPELADWELDAFPEEIQEYLLKKDNEKDTRSKGYKLASETFNADVPELKDFHAKASNVITEALGSEWNVGPAPVAVEYSGATEWSIPCGIFSTADLLIEDAMVGEHGMAGRHPLCVNLNHMVWDINFDGDKATGVNCFDLLERKQKTYRAKAVILAAGTLESAKIALQSNIPNKLVGQGITDHPIYYRHFAIPPSETGLSQRNAEPQSTKLIIRHQSATVKNHAFDVIVELGAQFNQGRFVDRDHIKDEIDRRQGYMLCEIVFQFYAPLTEKNCVTLNGWNHPVNVNMQECDLDPSLLREANDIAAKILNSLNAVKTIEDPTPLYENDDKSKPNLKKANLGGVAHEVGTLRMPSNGQYGVVDADLKFEGYQNLFACDNSVFPCSPAGNPSLTLVALARRCAKKVAEVVHQQRARPEECVPKPVTIPTGPIKLPVPQQEPVQEPVDIEIVEGTAVAEGEFVVESTQVEESSAKEVVTVQEITRVSDILPDEESTTSQKTPASVVTINTVAADAA